MGRDAREGGEGAERRVSEEGVWGGDAKNAGKGEDAEEGSGGEWRVAERELRGAE